MSISLKGKTAIVTGAGQGLGRQEALALAAHGAHVVVNDIGGGGDAVVAEIVAAGGSAEANNDDVSDWDGAKRLIDQGIAVTGSLDILVCNAGIVRDRMMYNMTGDEWDAVIRVHLRGHFGPLRHAGAHWRERFKTTGEPVNAHVVTTSSEAGFWGHEGQANYSTAKAGIIALTQVTARELGRFGVNANVLSPRGRTPMTDGAFGASGEIEGFDEWDPANIGPWVTFLASDEAAAINGQVFIAYGATVVRMQGWTKGPMITQDRQWTTDELLAAVTSLAPDLQAPIDAFPEIVPPGAEVVAR